MRITRDFRPDSFVITHFQYTYENFKDKYINMSKYFSKIGIIDLSKSIMHKTFSCNTFDGFFSSVLIIIVLTNPI